MNKKNTISVGIPIFNEETTISQLLTSILTQKEVSIKEVIIILDGSTDNSLEKIQIIRDKRIRIISKTKRLGKAYRLQQILSSFHGDVLMLMDGDVTIIDKHLFQEVMKTYKKTKPSIIGVHPYPHKPRNLLQRVLLSSITFQDYIKPSWNNGDNYLCFKGNMLLLEKTYAKSVSLPKNLVNDDAYFYFLAKKKQLKTVYTCKNSVFYTLPQKLSDHNMQSRRFQMSQEELQGYFPKKVLSYEIPKILYYKSMVRAIMKEHVFFISYLVLALLMRLMPKDSIHPTWNIAQSTKGGSYA